MALNVRKSPQAILFALVVQFNAFIKSFVTNNATLAYPHYDTSSTGVSSDYTSPSSTPLQVTAAAAADLPTTITLAENIRSVLFVHFADVLAHKVSDATNLALITVTAVPTAVDQGTADTLLNALATAWAHLSQSGVHVHSDSTNTVSAAAATSLSTGITLGNALKTAVNAHILFSPGSLLVNLTAP